MNSEHEKPVVYVISPTQELLDAIDRVLPGLEAHVSIFETFDEFIFDFDEDQPGCILFCLHRYDCLADQLVGKILHRCAHAQIFVFLGTWNVVEVVRAAKQGVKEVFVAPIVQKRFADCIVETLDRDKSNRHRLQFCLPQSIIAKLDKDEAMIFERLMQGWTTKEIASDLDISDRTVHYRKRSVYSKLGAANRNEAVELVKNIRNEPTQSTQGTTACFPPII